MNSVKYPRTFHMPWSQSETSDDVFWKDTSFFNGREIIVTEKMDGENTTIYHGGNCHARSMDSRHHPSRSVIKSLAGQIGYLIPENFRVCGENLFAYHSIFYTDLPSYFLVFGIYDENNNCLSWDDTEKLCETIGLHTVPILYRGVWDAKKIQSLWTGKGIFPTFATQIQNPNFPDDFVDSDAEGYVVRLVDSFHYNDFRQNCAKYVAPHFKSTMRDVHWSSSKTIPNLLSLRERNV